MMRKQEGNQNMLPRIIGPFRGVLLSLYDSADLHEFKSTYSRLTLEHPNYSHSEGDKRKIIIYYRYSYDAANVINAYSNDTNFDISIYYDTFSKTLHPEILYIEGVHPQQLNTMVRNLGGKVIHKTRRGVQAKFENFREAAFAHEELRQLFQTKFAYKSDIPIYPTICVAEEAQPNHTPIIEVMNNIQNESIENRDNSAAGKLEPRPQDVTPELLINKTNAEVINEAIKFGIQEELKKFFISFKMSAPEPEEKHEFKNEFKVVSTEDDSYTPFVDSESSPEKLRDVTKLNEELCVGSISLDKLREVPTGLLSNKTQRKTEVWKDQYEFQQVKSEPPTSEEEDNYEAKGDVRESRSTYISPELSITELHNYYKKAKKGKKNKSKPKLH